MGCSPRSCRWVCPLLCVTVVAATAPALARNEPAGKPDASTAPTTGEAPLVLKSNRFDGLKVVREEVPGVGVSVRVVINLHRVRSQRPTPGAGPVVASAALSTGEPARLFSLSGADRDVGAHDNSLIISVESSTDRWVDDLTAVLQGVSQPILDDEALSTARRRVIRIGGATDMDATFAQLRQRLSVVDAALVVEDGIPPVGLDTAVFHLEQAWSSDRMTLVVAGPVEAAMLDALLQKHFLVPADVPPAEPPPDPEPALGVDEENRSTPPGYLVAGQWARGVNPADAVVLAEFLHIKLDEETPQAADCDVRYLPGITESAVVAVCLGVQGSALDVRETMARAVDERMAVPPKAGDLLAARKMAVARLAADRVSSRRVADRVARWATGGLDGGVALERAVAATTEASLQAALQTLVSPGRAIRIRRVARTE